MFGRWRVLRLLLLFSLVAGVGAALATRHVSAEAAPFVKDRVSDLPRLRVGLVLGCAPTLADGRRNLYFERRMAAAIELFRAKRVDYLLLSGDHAAADYDEPSAMRQALVQAGVPESRLVLDYAGFRTLDSVARAKSVFGLREVIIVSQRFHNERAVYLARRYGLTAFGFDAKEVGGSAGARMAVREVASRLCAVLDAQLLHTQPRFAGPPVATPF
jgi:SanA protein